MITLIAISTIIALVWYTIAETLEKWGFEYWYINRIQHVTRLPYCMFCASFWVSVIAALVLYYIHSDAKLILVPLMVPGIFGFLWRR